MKTIPAEELVSRIRYDNRWWEHPHQIDGDKAGMKHRAYFDMLLPLVKQYDPRRAVVIMGPRRVGKTVIMKQIIQHLIDQGVAPQSICYLDLQSPTYAGIPLQRLLDIARVASGVPEPQAFFMMFDEVQYLRDWEVQLKNCVDHHSHVKFIVSGSAAAALRLKSAESGAGRFTDFLLPPLTFFEFLTLIGAAAKEYVTISPEEIGSNPSESYHLAWHDIEDLNSQFINYLNYGGYPEAILSPAVRSDPGRFIAEDIIEKVLTRDLPSLYGISDVQELNRLFTTIAYNTAEELSLDNLSTGSGVAKATIKRYVEYLESAFLIRVLHRVDNNAKKFSKANFFKVHLTNPCMRSALFGPLTADSEHLGHLVETAVFAQWLHSESRRMYYGRWQRGEVDMIQLDSLFRPFNAIEVKWSDRCVEDSSEIKSLCSFLRLHPKCDAIVTTRTKSCEKMLEGRRVAFIPVAVYCYFVGWLTIKEKRSTMSAIMLKSSQEIS